jgi:hypothetical protein
MEVVLYLELITFFRSDPSPDLSFDPGPYQINTS